MLFRVSALVCIVDGVLRMPVGGMLGGVRRQWMGTYGVGLDITWRPPGEPKVDMLGKQELVLKEAARYRVLVHARNGGSREYVMTCSSSRLK